MRLPGRCGRVVVLSPESPRSLAHTVPDVSRSEWDWSVRISSKFPADAHAAGPETSL